MTEQKGTYRKKRLVLEAKLEVPLRSREVLMNSKNNYTIESTSNVYFLNTFQTDIKWNSEENHKYLRI